MFKTGDKVQCINNKGIEFQVTLNRNYIVIDSNKDNICIETDNDIKDWFISNRFKLVLETHYKTIILDGIEYYLVPKE